MTSAGQQDPALDTDRAFSRAQLIALLAITLLAAALRLYRLGEWSLWVDEGHTYRDVTGSLESFWSRHVSRYPVAYLMLRGLLSVFPSNGEGWLRLPFVFFGIASVPVLALVGRGMVGRGPALSAALLLAVSPWHLYWSQNCRAYSLVLLLSLLAAGAFYQGLLSGSLGLMALTVGLTLLAGLCHPSAYLLLGAYLAYAWIARSRRAPRQGPPRMERWWPWLILGGLLVLLPLLIPAISYFRRAKPDFSLLHLLQTTAYFLRVPLAVFAVGGLLWIVRRGERSALFLACWGLVPLTVLAVIAATTVKVTAQYALYSLPAFCLLAGCAVHAWSRQFTGSDLLTRALRAVPLCVLALDMGGYDYLYFTVQHGDRPDWRSAARFVEREPTQRKRVLTTNGPTMLYYLDPGAWSTRERDPVEQVVEILPWDMADDPEGYLSGHVERARREKAALYVVITPPELAEFDPDGRLDRALRTSMLQVRRFPVWTGPKDMTVLVYALPGDG